MNRQHLEHIALSWQHVRIPSSVRGNGLSQPCATQAVRSGGVGIASSGVRPLDWSHLIGRLLTISHIDIEHEFPELWFECSLEESFPVFWPCRVDWANLETGRVEPDDVFLELFSVGVRVVTDVDVVLKGEGELAVGKILCRNC